MQHAIHCSGYNVAERGLAVETKNWKGQLVQAKYLDWNKVCFGDPERGMFGRITMSIRLARLLGAECIIWSTGATYQRGASEAEIMMESAFEHLTKKDEPIDWLRAISLVEQKSTNTLTSMHEAAQMIRDRFGNDKVMLHLVTSENHAPRVIRDATIAFHANRNVILSAVPAHTSYASQDASQVTIRELPE